jgi:hypothetical protein
MHAPEISGRVYKDMKGFYEREQTYSSAAKRRATLPPALGQDETPLQSPVELGRSRPTERSDLRGFATNQPQTCSSLGAVFQASNGKSAQSAQSARGDHQ